MGSNLLALKKLAVKLGCCESTKDIKCRSISKVIEFISTHLSMSGGGSHLSSITYKPVTGDNRDIESFIMSDGSVIEPQIIDLSRLTVKSVYGSQQGYTKLTVDEALGDGHFYKYSVNRGVLGGLYAGLIIPSENYTVWDGTSELELEDSQTVTVMEIDANNIIVAYGYATIASV